MLGIIEDSSGKAGFRTVNQQSVMFAVIVLLGGAFVSMQADAGAQVVQIFDSWASHLSPQDFDVFSGPYIKKVRLQCRGVLLCPNQFDLKLG